MKTQKRHLIILISLLAVCLNVQAANIYWNPNAANDNGNGTTVDDAVKSFSRAKSKVTSSSDVILLCETYAITSSVTLDGSKGSYNVTVTRKSEASPAYMFDIGPGVTVTLKNITISGGFPEDVHTTTRSSTYGNSLIFFSSDGTSYSRSTLNIETGTVLRDGWSNYGGAIKMYRGNTINMTGGEISNCGGTCTGGAIYLSAYRDTDATFNMSGGTINHCRSVQGGGAVSFSNFENASTTAQFSTFGHITFNMSGTARIEDCIYKPLADNSAETEYYGGGAVAIYQVAKENDASHTYVHQWKLNKFDMTGGTISNCHANCTHGFGGAIFVNNNDDDEATPVNISGNAKIIGCDCEKESGGAIYMRGKTSFSMDGGTIEECKSLLEYGGGIYITGTRSSSFELKGGAVIDNCDSKKHGGGVFLNGTITSCVINDAEIMNCDSYNNAGGGLHIASTTSDTIVLQLKKAEFHDNTAPSGGAIDIEIGKLIMDANVELYDNEATTGLAGAMNLRKCHLIMNGGKIYNNHSATDGGAIHLTRSAFILYDGEIYGNYCSGSGGVIHFSYCSASGGAPINGRVTLNGGKFHNNKAARGGVFNFNTNTVIDIPSTSTIEMYDNEASCGGIFSVDGAQLHIAGGTFHDNTALETCTYIDATNKGKGGVIFCQTWNGSNTAASLVRITGGKFYDNETSLYGGCAYVKNVDYSHATNVSATDVNVMEIQGGEIYDNQVGEAGGAIYFEDESELKMQGTVKIKGNRANRVPNNVYLLSDVNQTIEVTGAFTPQYVGIYTNTDATLAKSDIPVFEGAQGVVSDLNSYIASSTYKVVDDKQLHRVKYPGSTTLYFGIDSPWSPSQQTVTKTADLDPIYNETDEVYEISNVKQLTAFLWFVNGISTHDLSFSSTNPGAKGKLMADIDMEDHHWESIANYTGNFDGNGYTISHLTMVPTNPSSGRGMFGTNTSGTIKNVILRDSYMAASTGYVGIVVCQNNGTLSNSVADGEMVAADDEVIMGGLAGLNGGEIHSSLATPEMYGYQMGGLVGENTGNLYNSFANPQFNYSGPAYTDPEDPSTAYHLYVGGLVAENRGMIANCYVRLERAQSLTSALFGMLAGSNTYTVGGTPANGTIGYCYAPDGTSTQFNHSYTYLYNGVTTGLSNYDLYKKVDAPYLYDRPNDNLVGDTPMFKKLNEWVSSQINTIADLAYWKRSTAGGYSYTYNEVTYTGGNINDDYPIHKMNDMSCAASPDGLFIEYKKSLDDMIDKYNDLSGGGTIWLYASPKEDDGSDEKVSETNDSDVLLYIDEDASLLQSTIAKGTLTAYTSQTIPGNPRSWHFLSSSLTNSGIGFNYGQDATFNWEPNPCHVTISGNDDASLFPSDLPSSGGYADVSKIDLYAFYEPEYHWINLKRNSNSHWHMNATNQPINYTNETELTPGKGYLVSIDKDQLLQNRGTLNNGEVEIALGYTPAQEWAGLVGYNLIGNPYQSYLDFPAFASQNSGLWYDGSKGKAVEPTYAVYDDAMGGYIQYKEGSSRGSKSASGKLNMHQGFMVRSSGAARAKFTNAMRTNEGNGVSFRGEQPAYPLINLTVTDDEGVNDFAVLELGRDRDEGAEKLRANDSKGWLYLHHGSENYGILFRTEVDGYQPLWFEADEAGSYTLSWETANAEFEALTLVDNITGVVTDMLVHDRYTFEATPEQYASRFKIVVGDYKDIEENEAPEPVEGPTFAYVNNGNIVLTGLETEGEASLQIIDMTGRVILCRDASHASAISTDGIASGIYVLRLTDGRGTKIQKIVIE